MNYSGVIFDLLYHFILFLILSILFFLVGKGCFFKDVFHLEKSAKIVVYTMAIILLAIAVVYTGYTYNSVFVKKEIQMEQVIYSHAESYRGEGFSMTYYFVDDTGKKKGFDMCSFSRKHIMKEELEKGISYKVYYTQRTKEIIGIEKIY